MRPGCSVPPLAGFSTVSLEERIPADHPLRGIRIIPIRLGRHSKTVVGVMAIALAASLVLLAVDAAGLEIREPAVRFLDELHFRETLLHGMLAFLLFAGALHVDLGLLLGQKRVILSLATVGVCTVIAYALLSVPAMRRALRRRRGLCSGQQLEGACSAR